MPMKNNDIKRWQSRVQKVGFRETAIEFLRKRLCHEKRKEHVDRLIRFLSDYETHVKIIDLLNANPVWGRHIAKLMSELSEVTVNPEVHYIFQGEGNIPNIPTVGENRLYFGCGENFYALDAEKGTVVWNMRCPGKTWSLAWHSENSLYMCSSDRLYAVSASDGHERWRFEVDKELTSPYSHHGMTFVGSEKGTLYALNSKTGSRNWTFNIAGPISVAPGHWEDKIFSVSRDGTLFAIRVYDGECIWHFTTGGKIYAPPYVSDGIIYLPSSDHNIYALFAHNGRLLWSFTTGGEVHASPFEKHGIVYVGSKDKHLYALSIEDGKEIWRYKLFGYPSSATATRGMVYFSAQGRVYGFSVEDYKMRWFFPVGFSIATSPVVGYKRIYTGTMEGKLICLKLKIQFEEHKASEVLKQFMDVKF